MLSLIFKGCFQAVIIYNSKDGTIYKCIGMAKAFAI